MDNTICDFDAEVVRKFTERHPGQTVLTTTAATRKGWAIADDATTPEMKAEIKAIYSAPGFLAALPPIPGAVVALQAMRAAGFEIYLCTSPITSAAQNCGEKYSWVEQHLGKDWLGRVILTSDKTLAVGSVLIDDKYHITGQLTTPSWQHVLFARPYLANVSETGMLGRSVLRGWENWEEVLCELKSEEKIAMQAPS